MGGYVTGDRGCAPWYCLITNTVSKRLRNCGAREQTGWVAGREGSRSADFRVPSIGGRASWVTRSAALPGRRMLIAPGLQESHLGSSRDPGRSLSWCEGLSPTELGWEGGPGCGRGGWAACRAARVSRTPAQRVSNPLDIQIQPGLPRLPYFPHSWFIRRLIVSVIWGRSLNFYCFSVY